MTRDEAEKLLRETSETARLKALNIGLGCGKTNIALIDTIGYMCRLLDDPALLEASRVLARTPLMELVEETFREEVVHAP